MSDEEAFLNAIRASPDDDAPRLVYADWLDEHGQPEKAGYLRTEAALGAQGHGDGCTKIPFEILDEMRKGLDAGWVDAAGKRYNVVLQSCRQDSRTDVARSLARLVASEIRSARRIVDSVPCVVIEALPYSRAQTAVVALQFPRLGEYAWDLRPRPEAKAVAVVCPPTPLILPKRIPTQMVAAQLVIAEARRLGMTLNEFLNPDTGKNSVLRRALRLFEKKR